MTGAGAHRPSLLDVGFIDWGLIDWGFIARGLARNASAIVRCEACRLWLAGIGLLSECGGVELNTKGRYAVMAMADIAKQAGSPAGTDAIPLSQIAERQHISLAYLEQLFLRLRRAGLVESARGRAGGYRLVRPASAITVAEVMAAVEEDVRMTRCSGDAGVSCLGAERCLTHGLWDALGDEIGAFLQRVTLDDVVSGRIGKRPARGSEAPMTHAERQSSE